MCLWICIREVPWFYGFMVSQRGIEANPNKIQAILNIEPLKQCQRSPKPH